MEASQWSWARLNREQLGDLSEAERTLGADILLAYRPSQKAEFRPSQFMSQGLQVSSLNPSQVECLNGLEQKIEAVVVAYQKAG